MNILIADDERLIVNDLMDEVREFFPGAAIDGVTTAADALEAAAEKNYDIALLDIEMPDMDGLTLARKIIASWPAVNIIFVTGHKKYAFEAHELYCSAFLTKPVGSRKLRKAFENLRRPFIDVPEELSSAHYSGGAVIGRKLGFYREQRGLSVQEIADLMEVKRQTVYRWENGERIPDILTFIKLCRLLGVEVSEVLSFDRPLTPDS